jgi:hypothetical protein
LTQTGTVTVISPNSITVRSDDNYSQTYTLSPSTGAPTAPVAINDQVMIRATRTGQSAAVTSIDNPKLTGRGPTQRFGG